MDVQSLLSCGTELWLASLKVHSGKVQAEPCKFDCTETIEAGY